MRGPVITETFQAIYGSNVVQDIMTREAESRALRAHFWTDSALATKLRRRFISKDPVEKLEASVQVENFASESDGDTGEEMLAQEDHECGGDGMGSVLESSLTRVAFTHG